MRYSGFRYEIFCRAGVLRHAVNEDFLIILIGAVAAKREEKRLLANATIRARIFAPNGQRVSRADLVSAFRALANDKVRQAVESRIQAAFAAVPARSEARTETAAKAARFSACGGSDFCQAGVVAPPDSLTGETRPISGDSL